jgi:hypothetical protein
MPSEPTINPEDFRECLRCHDLFIPKEITIGELKIEAKFCEDCQYRNVIDALDLPTPPEMLDQFTIKPCLSKWEYEKRMNEERMEALTEQKLA